MRNNSPGTILIYYYFHSNAIGSTTAVTGANGNIVERYRYGLFGMPTYMDAAGNVIPKSTIGNNILFHGREYEHETNFFYFRSRHLDPIMGRFLQKGRDSLEKGKSREGGKYIGVAMHIIQDSFAPSHAARNENMEITRIQDYSAQNSHLHKKLGDFKYKNEKYWNAAVKACRTILILILQNNFDEQQIIDELWNIFKYDKNIPNKKIMVDTERIYTPDEE